MVSKLSGLMPAETRLYHVVGMYFVVSLELFRLLYVRLQEGRRTLYLLVTAVIIFSLITVVRMVILVVALIGRH